MANTDHARPSKRETYAAADRFGRRQPRPAPRRQGTRHAVIAAAYAEQG